MKWENRYVAGISRASALTKTTQVVRHRVGGDPGVVRVSPGQTEYGTLTLERGVTHDLDFEIWANKIWDYGNSSKGNTPEQIVSLKDFRRDITLELYNEAGQKVIAYNIYRCWVSEYTALPELDGMGNAIAIQSVTIENEGWERDISVQEPTQTSFDLPGAQP